MQSGGGMQALKAVAASLAGPAGILLGISLVTSALTAFGPEIKRIFQGAAADVEDFKKVLDSVLDADFDFSKYAVRNAEQAAAAIEVLYNRAVVETDKAERARIYATINRLMQLQKEYQDTADVLKMLEGTGLEETDESIDETNRAVDALSAALERDIDSSIMTDALAEIAAAAERAGDEFQTLKLRRLELDQAVTEEPKILTESDESALADMIEKERAANEKRIEENDRVRLAVTDSELAIEEARKRSLEAYIGSVDTEIKTAGEVAGVLIDTAKQIIQAKLAETIAKALASLGPAAPFVGPALAAGIYAIFNSLVNSILPGSTGGKGGGGSAGGSYGRGGVTSSRAQPAPVRGGSSSVSASVALGGGMSLDPTGAIVSEMRATRKALEQKEFRLKGTDLVTSSTRTTALQKEAGQI